MDIKLTKYTGKIKLYPHLTNQMGVKQSNIISILIHRSYTMVKSNSIYKINLAKTAPVSLLE